MMQKIKYQYSIIDTIQRRRSVRTYTPTPINAEERETLKSDLESMNNKAYRFSWFEWESGNGFLERTATYGVIKGARAFMIGIIQKDAENQKDTAIQFGYDFEQLILKATELGLGTCWLGGIFNAAAFTKGKTLEPHEKVIMLSPVGIPETKQHLISRITSKSANSSTRKPWQEIFIDHERSDYLSESSAGKYAPALEMVRLAPSAVNSQPWRVIKTKNAFHFYSCSTKYFALGREKFLRYNDMGIALAHFELACRHLGLQGEWFYEHQLPDEYSNLEYIRSWKPR